MKDIPVFTTENGVASLFLREVSYRQESYICFRDVQPQCFPAFLEECVGFCKAVGAEKVYAAGHPELESFPLHTVIYEMQGRIETETSDMGNLWPVTEETVSQWRQIYNERMADVDNAATLTQADEKRILRSGGAYFVHDAGQLLGIGWLEEGCLMALASVLPGAGKRVLRTLLSTASEEHIGLEVASTNEKAIHLYEKMGFIKTAEKSRWYDVKL